jgi:hypothetical protein
MIKLLIGKCQSGQMALLVKHLMGKYLMGKRHSEKNVVSG